MTDRAAGQETIRHPFPWIRGWKIEAGVLRVFADAPDVEAARRILAVGHAIAGSEASAAG